MWKQYYTPATFDEALHLLNTHHSHARIIAGGTDMMIELERGLRPAIDTLIDITRIPGLADITLEDGRFTLGARVTHNQVVAHTALQQQALPLVLACWEVGAPQIRNRATVAGNLITGSPANDTITPLMALNASVTLRSVDGERIIPLNAFYTGVRRTVMQPNELMVSLSFDALQANQVGTFFKLALRRAQAISVVNAAAVLTLADEIVTEAKITLGSVAPTIIRVPEAEAALIGKPLTEDSIRAAARIAASVPKPISDVRGSAEYRQEMVGIVTARVLRRIAHHDTALPWSGEPTLLWGEQAAQDEPALSAGLYHDHQQAIETTINGVPLTLSTGQDHSLLDLLRDHAGQTGSKEGCAEGECGACTVFLNGAAVMSCMVPAPRAHDAEIVTIEGLSANGTLHPLQQAFVEQGAVQCGYCTPGFVMAGAKLLEEHPTPTAEQIQTSISGNLCRCTGYYKIIQAFRQASQSIAGD